MERYFRLLPESELHKDWLAYKRNLDLLRELYKQFSDEQGIEADAFYMCEKELHIVPKGADEELFGNSLCRPENELRKFKAGSKVAKAWAKALDERGLKAIRKPMVILYVPMCYGGRYRTRLFDVNDTVYCSLDGLEIKEVPEGWEEMKASEFFRIIEENQSA